MLKFGGWSRLTWGRGPKLRGSGSGSCRPAPGAGRDVRCCCSPATGPGEASTTRRVRRPPASRLFGPPRAGGAGGHSPRPVPPWGRSGASGGVTPRQACPRPGGLGRNLRSKTRWFAGFCNSHQVSHFATFFIDARAEISVAGSRVDFRFFSALPRPLRGRRGGGSGRVEGSLARRCARRFGSGPPRPRRSRRPPRGGGGGRRRRRAGGRSVGHGFAVVRLGREGLDNDPSAGSPTETLLRLLLPLNDKVQWTSRDVAGGGPPPSPRSEHFTGPFNR